MLAVAAPARAGGWVSVTLDAPLTHVQPGEVQHIGLMVRQHGVTPIHTFNSTPLQVSFTARQKESGRTLQAEAHPDSEVGHFSVAVTFPVEGTWLIQVIPAPFQGIALDPVTVGTAPATTAVTAVKPAPVQVQAAQGAQPAAAPSASARTGTNALAAVLLLAFLSAAGGMALAMAMQRGRPRRAVERARPAAQPPAGSAAGAVLPR
jgi:hypothetical protein